MITRNKVRKSVNESIAKLMEEEGVVVPQIALPPDDEKINDQGEDAGVNAAAAQSVNALEELKRTLVSLGRSAGSVEGMISDLRGQFGLKDDTAASNEPGPEVVKAD